MHCACPCTPPIVLLCNIKDDEKLLLIITPSDSPFILMTRWRGQYDAWPAAPIGTLTIETISKYNLIDSIQTVGSHLGANLGAFFVNLKQIWPFCQIYSEWSDMRIVRSFVIRRIHCKTVGFFGTLVETLMFIVSVYYVHTV